MFDKKEYWKRRKAGQRGQEYPEPVFHPKGHHPVKYINREGKEADYPNDMGQHFGRGVQNRKQYREKLTSRTKPNQNRKSWVEHIRDGTWTGLKRNAGEHERATKKKEE